MRPILGRITKRGSKLGRTTLIDVSLFTLISFVVDGKQRDDELILMGRVDQKSRFQSLIFGN